MKKATVILASILVFSLLLGGCATPTAAPTTTSPQTEVTSTAASETSSVKDIKVPGWDPSDESDILSIDKSESEYGAIPKEKVKQGMRIGVILPEPSNEYWQQIAAGITEECESLGIIADIQHALNTEDQAGQLAAAETLMQKNCDAYIFSPLTTDLLINVVEEIKAQGKPIINTYFPPMQDSDVFVGAMDATIAKSAAQKTIELLGGKGKVAIAMGAVASRVNQVRCGLYAEYLTENSDIEIVEEMMSEWVPEKARQMTQDLLTRTPDVQLIWCANDNLALGVIEGLRSSDALDKVKVLSMDATSAALQAVKQGEMYGTYNSEPVRVGKVAVDMALRMATGQKVARVIEVPAVLVEASNVDQYLNK